MRVLVVADWMAERGGTEAYLTWMVDGLRAAGEEVRLLVSSAGSAADGNADYVAYGSSRRVEQALLQLANPSAIRQARRALKDFQPDVAYVVMFANHLSPAVVSGLSDRVPTVLYVTDYKVICPIARKLLPNGSICRNKAGWVCRSRGCVGSAQWLRDQPRYALIRRGMAGVHRILSCGPEIQRRLIAEGVVSESLPAPVPLVSEGYRRDRSPDPTLVYVGRLSVEKGVDVLLRAFGKALAESSAEGARLRVVGDGPERSALVALADSLGVADRVDFLGHRPPEDVESELSRAWALVAPSVWAEPLGLVAVEAIVRAVPVVASRTGGFAGTVREDATGLLVANGDVDAWAEALGEVLEGRDFPGLTPSSRHVRELALRHGVGPHVERLREVFRDAIEG